MKQCIEKIQHIPKDGSKCLSTKGHSLQVWLNEDESGKKWFSGFCFACNKFVDDPYGDNPPKPEDIHVKTQEEIDAELAEITSCPTVPEEYRSIEPEWWKYYGVRLLVSEYDGKTPNAIAHPYTRNGKLVRWKIKLYGSKKFMWSVGDTKDNDPYGWERAKRAGGQTLYITEGEEDAIALTQILKTLNLGTQYEALDYAVISLSDGVDSVNKCLSPKLDEIRQRWKQVCICFDNDEPGKRGAKEAWKLFPDAHIAMLPANDANDCLKKGLLKATREAVLWQAAKPVPSSVITADDILDDVLEEPTMGLSYPWEALTRMAFGQRRQELISIGGSEGGGKTTLAHMLAAWDIVEHGWTVLGAFMEETPAESFKNIAGKIDGIPYHIPGREYDKEQLKKTVIDVLKPSLHIWDREQAGDPHTTWEGMKSSIRSLGNRLDLFILDNLTTLTEGMNSSERNDFIGVVVSDIIKLQNQFDFQTVVLSHLNAPDKGARQHEAGGRVLQSQFTGSRALARYSHFMIGFERNKQAEDNSCSYIRVLKARKFGKTGFFKSYYETYSGRLVEREWDDELYKDKKTA